MLLPSAYSDGPEIDPAIIELTIIVAALRPEESRGAHFLVDFSAIACRRVTPRTLGRAAQEMMSFMTKPGEPD